MQFQFLFHTPADIVVMCRAIGILAKIEDSNSLRCLEDIIRVSDGVMVARGDLGAQLSLEDVPAVQQVIVDTCRRLNKPVIVASQLLESMIEFPTPTRAEVGASLSLILLLCIPPVSRSLSWFRS